MYYNILRIYYTVTEWKTYILKLHKVALDSGTSLQSASYGLLWCIIYIIQSITVVFRGRGDVALSKKIILRDEKFVLERKKESHNVVPPPAAHRRHILRPPTVTNVYFGVHFTQHTSEHIFHISAAAKSFPRGEFSESSVYIVYKIIPTKSLAFSFTSERKKYFERLLYYYIVTLPLLQY